MQFGDVFGVPFGTFITVQVSAVLFGCLYALWVDHQTKEVKDPDSALRVVLGVLVSLLLAVPLVGWSAFAWLLSIFALTGTPMIFGRSWRSQIQRRQELNDVRNLTRGGNGN